MGEEAFGRSSRESTSLKRKVMQEILFTVFSALGISSVAAVVFSRNAVNSAMFMILAFVATAGMFVMLNAYFLGILQVLVYAGAVMVLFLFIIMLLNVAETAKKRPDAGSLIFSIAAMSLNRAIGKKNALPWDIPEELQWFKEKTLNQIVLMGRNTFEAIGRPLPKRISVVVSRTMKPQEGVHVIEHLYELEDLDLPQEKDIWLIGGGQLYEAGLKHCSDLYLTHVHQHIVGADAFMPPYEDCFSRNSTVKETDQYSIHHYVNDKPKALEKY